MVAEAAEAVTAELLEAEEDEVGLLQAAEAGAISRLSPLETSRS